VTPVGGITTRPSSPYFMNNCRISAADVLAGRFFARMIVLDLCFRTWHRSTNRAQCLIMSTFLQLLQHTVERPSSVHQFKVFNHLTFNVNDPNLVITILNCLQFNTMQHLLVIFVDCKITTAECEDFICFWFDFSHQWTPRARFLKSDTEIDHKPL
jgi:hypothetical protein